MAYGLKYWYQFDDIHPFTKAVWKVNISFKDFTGDALEILTMASVPLKFIKGVQSDDKFEPILGSEADLGIVITDEKVVKPEDFIFIDEDAAKVEIYKDSVIYWTGFIKQDFIQYRYTSTPYEFIIPATDRISLMKSHLLDIQTEINATGEIKLGDILLSKGLYETQIASGLNLLSSLRHPTPDGMTYPGGQQGTFLDQLTLRYELFIDNTGYPINIYDALVMFARSFAGRIFYSKNTFHFQRINDLFTEKPTVSVYTDGDYPDSKSNVAIRKILKGEISSSDAIYANADAAFQIEGASKQEKMDLDYIRRGYLLNYTWSSYVDNKFPNWYTVELTTAPDKPEAWQYISQQGAGTTDDPYTCFFKPSNNTAYIGQTVTGIVAGDIYTLNFKILFHGLKNSAYQIHVYQDSLENDSPSHFYFDGSSWKQANDKAEDGSNPLPGAPVYHVKFQRPEDLRKNEVDINVTLPKVPNIVITVAGNDIILAPNIMQILFIDPDNAVGDGTPTADRGINIYTVTLGHTPYGYTGEIDTMRNPANYSIQNDNNDIKIIDGFDSFANSLQYGSFGTNNGGNIGTWVDDYLSSFESHSMTLRSIAEQNRKPYKEFKSTLFSNTMEFENVIQQAFGAYTLFLQMYDEYDVKQCLHSVQLLELIDPAGATAAYNQKYKF